MLGGHFVGWKSSPPPFLGVCGSHFVCQGLPVAGQFSGHFVRAIGVLHSIGLVLELVDLLAARCLESLWIFASEFCDAFQERKRGC